MNTLPDISIRLHGAITPQRCVGLATAAEEAGFTGAWFAENAFARGILPAAAACTVATRRLRIGTGVFNPFVRHPTLMAMEIGALDELAQGRVSLSIGSGIAGATRRLGLDPERPLPSLRDTIAIVRQLLDGGTADHGGRGFSARGVKLDFTPRAGIPLYLAGRGDLTVKLAGELTDGLIVSNMCAQAFAGRIAASMQASRRAAGRGGDGRVVQYMPCVVNQDRAAALRGAKRAVAEMLPGFWTLGQTFAAAKDALLTGTGIAEQEFAAAAARLRNGDDPDGALDERFAAAFSLFGTPEECLAGAAAYADAGVTEVALTFAGASAADDIRALGTALHARRRT